MSISNQEQAVKTIKTIGKAAGINAIVTDEMDEGLTPQLEKIAAAIVKNYELNETAMDEYHAEVDKAIEAESAEIAHQEVEEAVDIIYEMCGMLDEPSEIMNYIWNTREMMYVCGLIS